jgi:hypothetical protein
VRERLEGVVARLVAGYESRRQALFAEALPDQPEVRAGWVPRALQGFAARELTSTRHMGGCLFWLFCRPVSRSLYASSHKCRHAAPGPGFIYLEPRPRRARPRPLLTAPPLSALWSGCPTLMSR